MNNRPPGFAIVMAITILLAACARSEGRWEKSGINGDERRADVRACNAYARDRMNSHEIRQEERFHGRAIDAQAIDRNDDLAGVRRIMEADHIRRKEQFFDDCMRASGYRRAPADGG